MAGWNQDALKAVASIRATITNISAEESSALDAALAAVENNGKPNYTKEERAKAHEAIANVEQLIGPKAREAVDRLKAAFDLTLGPET